MPYKPRNYCKFSNDEWRFRRVHAIIIVRREPPPLTPDRDWRYINKQKLVNIWASNYPYARQHLNNNSLIVGDNP